MGVGEACRHRKKEERQGEVVEVKVCVCVCVCGGGIQETPDHTACMFRPM